MSASGLPLPPIDLLQRTGNWGPVDPERKYLENGTYLRGLIESMLPADWSWKGKKVLDFGCGAGKVLRHFVDEAGEAEFWGCDIHGPSIEWMDEHLCPPFHVFECREEPGLPQADGYFDLVFALSVYTHITDHWAGWLLEHHRVLADDGLLLASVLGEVMIEPLTGQQWDDDKIGMNPLLAGYPWDRGGPITFISPWWLRAHWGRAFEILDLRPSPKSDPPTGQDLVLARPRSEQPTEEDLVALEPNEPREISALRHHVRQLRAETLDLRAAHDNVVAQLDAAVRGGVDGSAQQDGPPPGVDTTGPQVADDNSPSPASPPSKDRGRRRTALLSGVAAGAFGAGLLVRSRRGRGSGTAR